jgi:cullin-associated NEDD8-dissociated protein 1
MATNDMIAELKKNPRIDVMLERRICEAVLRQLDDTNADVQSVAIKCISQLVLTVQEQSIQDIVESLCHHLLSGKEGLTDIYSIGLKCVVTGAPTSNGPVIARGLTSRLLDGISSDRSESQSVRSECIAVLKDLLTRFGVECGSTHENTMGVLLTQVGSAKSVVHKRATTCLGVLAPYLPDHLLSRLATTLLQRIESAKGSSNENVHAYIQAIGRISRSVGHRLGRSIDSIIPLFLEYLGDPADDNEALQSESVCELRENILHAFEAFAERCPAEVAAHMDTMLDRVIGFMAFDPNYTYDDSDEDSDAEMADGSDYEDEEEDDYDDYDDFGGDDDDNTWKVRRASVKVIQAFIVSRPELLQQLYNQCTDSLVGRLKEREESVKTSIIVCLEELMKTTASRRRAGSRGGSAGASRTDGVVALLEGKKDAIVNAICRLLKDKKTSVKVKTALFGLFSHFMNALDLGSPAGTAGGAVSGQGISAHFNMLVPLLATALRDRNGNLKLQVLQFLQMVLESHASATVSPHATALIPAVIACASEDWYKIIAQSLRVISAFVCVLRPIIKDSGGRWFLSSAAPAAGSVEGELLGKMFDVTLMRLSQNDIDQEIKDCAIEAMGGLVAHFGDCDDQNGIGLAIPSIWPLIQTRLRNEVTRIATLSALRRIAESPLDTSIAVILEDIVQCLASFMRQQLRTLKLAALITSDAILRKWGRDVSPTSYASLIEHMSGLVNDRDLHMSHLALKVASSAVLANASANQAVVQQYVLSPALSLAASPVLQERSLCLTALLELFATLVLNGLSASELLGMLVQPIQKQGECSKQTIASVSKCVATACLNAGASANAECSRAVETFVQQVAAHLSDGSGISKSSAQLALYCIGEIGAQRDLSAHENSLSATVLSAIASKTDDVRSAAAFCLGSMAVGNMNVYVPKVLAALQSGSNQYQLLTSIKEMVSRHVDSSIGAARSGSSSDGAGSSKSSEMPRSARLDFSPFMAQVLPVLRASSSVEEEAVRNMVAECFGKLAVLDARNLLPELTSMTQSEDKLARWTAMSSLRYAVISETPETREALKANIGTYLALLNDADLDVKRAALLSLNAIIHHQSDLVQDLLAGQVMSVLYEATKIVLVRVIDLGPFKHKVDDGLPLRKAAYACMDSILTELRPYVDVSEFIPKVCEGLKDSNTDVKMLCHQLLIKLCRVAPADVYSSLATILPALDKAVTKKAKDAQVGTEAERRNDGKFILGLSLCVSFGIFAFP